jgi:hypothetical protein
MKKKEAVELIKQSLTEIPNLRKLHYDNQNFKLWKSKMSDVIKAGLEQTDYENFTSAHREDNTVYVIQPGVTSLPYDKFYQEDITAKETSLKSIIQKYEILGVEEKTPISIAPEEIFQLVAPKAFISHGKESAALRKLKELVETLGIEPLIVKKLASIDKDVPEKVNLYLNQADFVIILATADDTVIDKITGKETKQPRQNVIHEIGLAQKTHPGRIIYLLEAGAEFPSNIRPKVWESFKQRNMMDTFLGIVRELRAYNILTVTKYPIKGA